MELYSADYRKIPNRRISYWEEDCWGTLSMGTASHDVRWFLKAYSENGKMWSYGIRYNLADKILSLGFLELLDELSTLPEFHDCIANSRVCTSYRNMSDLQQRMPELRATYRSIRYLLRIQDSTGNRIFQDVKYCTANNTRYCNIKDGKGFAPFVVTFRDRQPYTKIIWNDPIIFDYCTRMALTNLLYGNGRVFDFQQELRMIIGRKGTRGRQILKEVYISTKCRSEDIVRRYLPE